MKNDNQSGRPATRGPYKRRKGRDEPHAIASTMPSVPALVVDNDAATKDEAGSNIVRLGQASGKRDGGRVKDANGLTRLQEAFAKAYGLECMTLTEAYRKSYNPRPEVKAAMVHRMAFDTKELPHVKKRIEYYEVKRVRSNLHSAEKVRTFLVEKLREEAENQNNRPSDRLKAMELLGKVDYVGLFKERTLVETAEVQSAADIKAQIDALLTGTDT